MDPLHASAYRVVKRPHHRDENGVMVYRFYPEFLGTTYFLCRPKWRPFRQTFSGWGDSYELDVEFDNGQQAIDYIKNYRVQTEESVTRVDI